MKAQFTVIVATAFLLACSSGVNAPDNPGNENSAQTMPAVDQRPPCPAEQLSCGKQEPVVSDGTNAFENEEMGIRVLFPRGSRVCMGRSGDAARGFYTVFDKVDAPCAENGLSTHFLGLSSSFNAMDYMSVRQAGPENCRPLFGIAKEMIGGTKLSISGHASLVCQEKSPEGKVRIFVYALAGRQNASNAPEKVYWASFGSSEKHLAKNLPRFLDFLKTAKIGSSTAQ